MAAGAQPTVPDLAAGVAVRVRLTPAPMFAVADKAVAAGKLDVSEQALRALATHPDVQVRSEARYRLAILLAGAGRNRNAALLLRQLLDEQPNSTAARLQLATTLQRLGD